MDTIKHTDDTYYGPHREIWAKVEDGKIVELARSSDSFKNPWSDDLPQPNFMLMSADPTRFGVPQKGGAAVLVTGCHCGIHDYVSPLGHPQPNPSIDDEVEDHSYENDSEEDRDGDHEGAEHPDEHQGE